MDPAQSKFVWMETVPDGWNRVLEAQRKGPDLNVVDPRGSTTADRADTLVANVRGQDWAFLPAVLHVIDAERLECMALPVLLSGFDVIVTRALTRTLADL